MISYGVFTYGRFADNGWISNIDYFIFKYPNLSSLYIDQKRYKYLILTFRIKQIWSQTSCLCIFYAETSYCQAVDCFLNHIS